MKRPLALLAPLALALGVGLVWLASGALDAGSGPGALAAGPGSGGVTDLAGESTELAALPEQAADAESERAEAAPEQAFGPLAGVSAARRGWWKVPKGSVWVHGRVELPEGTPLDERVFVTAEGSRFAERTDAPKSVTVEVAQDGTFTVAFSSRTLKKGRLTLHGRYVYLPEAHWLKIRAPEEVVLKPLLGGRVVARVLPPRAAAMAAEALEGITVEATTGGFVASSRREGWLLEPGEFELGGLEPERAYTLVARTPRFANGTTSEVEVAPGETLMVDVELGLGARLSGTVIDVQGTPIDDARVAALTPQAVEARNPILNPTPEGETSTSDGRFELLGVAAGEIVLVVEADGFLDAELDLGELLDGAERHDLVVRMDRGRIVSGVVRWPDGSPAQGATVRCAQGEAFGQFELERVKGEVVLGPDGCFEFSALVEGECNLTAEAIHPEDRPDPGSRVSMLRAKRIPRWMARAEKVAPGARNLVLTLSPGNVLSGTVVDDLGKPIEAFRVSASPKGNGMLTATSMRPVRGHFKDPRGRFHLQGVQPGQWNLRAGAAGYGDSERRLVTIPGAGELRFVLPRSGSCAGLVRGPDGHPAPRARVNVTHGGSKSSSVMSAADGTFDVGKLEPGRVVALADSDDHAASEPLEFELPPGGRREGLVLALREGATLTVEVHPEAGERSGRSITLSGRSRRQERTDDGGSAVFEGLGPGTYEVTLAPPEGTAFDGDPEGWMLRIAQQESEQVQLTVGERARIVLGGPRSTAVNVVGRITQRGEPVPRAMVMATPVKGGRGRPEAAARTDDGGEYAFVLDRPGEYRFQVGGDWGDRVTFVEEVPEVEEHRVDLEIPEARIVGTVTGPGGEPLEGLRVTLSADGDSGGGFFNQRIESTDSEGGFEFGNLRPGTYLLRAGGSDGFGGFGGLTQPGAQYGRALISAEVAEDERTLELPVRLKAAGEITGTVTAADGTPVMGARIEVTDADGRRLSRWSNVRSGPEGSYRYQGVAPGTYLVKARSAGKESEGQEVRVYEGGESDAPLILE